MGQVSFLVANLAEFTVATVPGINVKQESPADAGIPARRKNDEKNSSISKL